MQKLLIIMLALFPLACAHTVKRVEASTQSDLSGNWNDTDARLTSQALIQDCFSAAWLSDFSDTKKRKPAVRVRGIVNKTDEHIDAQVFIKNIERAMINSGKVRVLAQEGEEQGSMRREQGEATSGAQSDSTPVSVANEAGADFVVAVRMASILDQIEGKKAKFYKINFELIDSTTGEKVWIGDHEIKKYIAEGRITW
jgi:penicillin-binding protein activator